MAEQFGQSWPGETRAEELERVGLVASGFNRLDPETRRSIAESLAVLTRALTRDGDSAPSGSLASVADLRSRMGPGGQDGGSGSAEGDGQVQSTGTAPAGTPASRPGTGQNAPSSQGSGGTSSRVGDVARATLGAIDFPAFVAGLIQGTFHAIVDASIQQMEAYAELLKNVAMNVDKFMSDNISEDSARDHLADQYDDVFDRDTSSGSAKLTVKKNGSAPSQLPSFLSDLGFQSTDDIDDDAINNTIVPAARRDMAQTRQQTLATMVLMGINRVVVDDGEIDAKLQFHVDAAETTKITFNQKKTTNGTISGRAGQNPFSANAIMVNTVNMNAQSDLNVRADLTGEVRVKFRSETFPLERFADSAAIQLINQNAKVPQSQPPSQTGAAPATGATPTAAPATGATPTAAPSTGPATGTAPAPSPTPSTNAPAAQSLGTDPWSRP
jgi:hypothetical protein